VTDVPGDVPRFTIRDDYDPGGERLTADTDPMGAYLTYLEDVRLGCARDMGFTPTDFREYIVSRHGPLG